MLERTLSKHWLCFLLRLKVQLSIDTLSYQCKKACERSGCWNIDWGLRPGEVVRNNHKRVSCHSGCVTQKKAYTDISRRCHRDVRKEVEASLDIKDVIDQTSYFSKTIVMDITPPSIHWLDIPNSIFCSLSLTEPVRYQLSIEWQSLENNVSHSQVASVIVFLHHPSWKLRCWNGSSVSAKIKFHRSYDPWYWAENAWPWSNCMVCAQPNRIFL